MTEKKIIECHCLNGTVYLSPISVHTLNVNQIDRLLWLCIPYIKYINNNWNVWLWWLRPLEKWRRRKRTKKKYCVRLDWTPFWHVYILFDNPPRPSAQIVYASSIKHCLIALDFFSSSSSSNNLFCCIRHA